MENIWDDTISEYDLISEDIENAEEIAEEIAESVVGEMETEEPELVEATDEQLEEILETAAYDLDKKETNVIYNARLRLEQAKLYEMLINHSLFAGVDASPDAVKIVENELKHFIVKRLEVLLGIRKPKIKEVAVSSEIELPFNATEINFLKQLAYKGTLGKSATDAPVKASIKPSINPLVGSTKSSTIPTNTPKVKSAPQQQELEPPNPPQAPKRKKRIATAQASPIKNTPNVKPNKNATTPRVSSGGAHKRNMSQTEALALAKADIEAMKNRKPIHKLKGKDKIKAILEVNEKHKRKQVNGGMPVPDAKQLEMHYLTREANGRSPEGVINDMVKNILNTSKLKIK